MRAPSTMTQTWEPRAVEIPSFTARQGDSSPESRRRSRTLHPVQVTQGVYSGAGQTRYRQQSLHNQML